MNILQVVEENRMTESDKRSLEQLLKKGHVVKEGNII